MAKSPAERQRESRARKTPKETKRVPAPKGPTVLVAPLSERVASLESYVALLRALEPRLVALEDRVEALEKPGKDPLAYQKPSLDDIRERIKTVTSTVPPRPAFDPDSWDAA